MNRIGGLACTRTARCHNTSRATLFSGDFQTELVLNTPSNNVILPGQTLEGFVKIHTDHPIEHWGESS